jgi:glycosyltransferase involved in cell wall biosynthesis
MPLKKPRVVIAGQVPPPLGGQNLMIQKAIAQFARSDCCDSVHLPFFFTPDVKSARKGSLVKIAELVRVIGRLLRIRMAGPIDILLYPSGGPQMVPMIRDLLLLPWMLILSRHVILHFHAAGIGEQLRNGENRTLARLVSSFYRLAFAAVVATDFNRRDPEAIGIERILVVPLRINDDFDPMLVQRGADSAIRLLYVGHLCSDKGTPQLLQAFATLRQKHPAIHLDLVGECLPPFTLEDLETLLDNLGIRSGVRLCNVLTGGPKAEAFAKADLFVFPTIAPYESFGLVLAEAMAWGLPIVASQWRGNSDVLTSSAGAICFPLSSSFTTDIVAALAKALDQRSQWSEWGRINRSIFQERYCENEGEEWLVKPIVSLVASKT